MTYTPPKLEPVRIPTVGLSIFARVWVWLTKTRQWRVAENWSMTLPSGERIVIPAGFVFDGASVPRPLWFILSPTGLLLIPGLIHDFAYRYDYLWVKSQSGGLIQFRHGAGRKYWDQTFLDVGRQVNGMVYIDYAAWLMIRLFGGYAWRDNRKLDAPQIL